MLDLTLFVTLYICACLNYSLYQKIDTEKLQCLNESEEGAGKTVFKPWDERLDKTKVRIIYTCTVACMQSHLHGLF